MLSRLEGRGGGASDSDSAAKGEANYAVKGGERQRGWVRGSSRDRHGQVQRTHC